MKTIGKQLPLIGKRLGNKTHGMWQNARFAITVASPSKKTFHARRRW